MAKNKFLLLFVLCCVVPLAAAKLVLSNGWFSSGVNSQGQWLSKEIHLLPPSKSTDPHWRLVYLAPQQCLQDCLETIDLMQKVYLALGRKQQQLALVVLTEQPLAALPVVMNQHLGSAQGLPTGQLVLVENQGLALLQYPVPADLQQRLLTGKAVMTDLKKLMNYDRGPV